MEPRRWVTRRSGAALRGEPAARSRHEPESSRGAQRADEERSLRNASGGITSKRRWPRAGQDASAHTLHAEQVRMARTHGGRYVKCNQRGGADAGVVWHEPGLGQRGRRDRRVPASAGERPGEPEAWGRPGYQPLPSCSCPSVCLLP